PDVRNVAKREGSQRECEPEPPCFLPEMIIYQRGKNARHQSNPNPNCLAFNEKINVAMAIACVCACAEKHHNANDKQSQHCQKKYVSAFTMHEISNAYRGLGMLDPGGTTFRKMSDRQPPVCS